MRACSDREEQRNDGRLYIQKPGSPPYKVVLPSCKSSRVCPLSPSLSPPCSLLSSFPQMLPPPPLSSPTSFLLAQIFFILAFSSFFILYFSSVVLFPPRSFYSFLYRLTFSPLFINLLLFNPFCVYLFVMSVFFPFISICYKFIIVAVSLSVFRQRCFLSKFMCLSGSNYFHFIDSQCADSQIDDHVACKLPVICLLQRYIVDVFLN